MTKLQTGLATTNGINSVLSAIGSLSIPAASAIATAVWSTVITGSTQAGSVLVAWLSFMASYVTPATPTDVADAQAAIIDAIDSTSAGEGTLTGISTGGVIALRNALTGVDVTSVRLVDDSGSLSVPLVQGDTYEAATGTGIPIPCPNASLVGWTPELAIDVAGKVVVVTATAITDWSLPIYFDMTAAQSSSLPTGVDGTCVLRFTKSGKTHTTTVNGRVTVTARIG